MLTVIIKIGAMPISKSFSGKWYCRGRLELFLVKYQFYFLSYILTGKYWSLGRPDDAPSNVPRMSPKDPI